MIMTNFSLCQGKLNLVNTNVRCSGGWNSFDKEAPSSVKFIV